MAKQKQSQASPDAIYLKEMEANLSAPFEVEFEQVYFPNDFSRFTINKDLVRHHTRLGYNPNKSFVGFRHPEKKNGKAQFVILADGNRFKALEKSVRKRPEKPILYIKEFKGTREEARIYLHKYHNEINSQPMTLFAQAETSKTNPPMKGKLTVVAADKQEGKTIVKQYEQGGQKGIELHFHQPPTVFTAEALKKANFRFAYRKGKPYRFKNLSKASQDVAIRIGKMQQRTAGFSGEKVKEIQEQQKKGPVFITREKEIVRKPVEGAFKLPEIPAPKGKTKAQTPAKKTAPKAPAKPTPKTTAKAPGKSTPKAAATPKKAAAKAPAKPKEKAPVPTRKARQKVRQTKRDRPSRKPRATRKVRSMSAKDILGIKFEMIKLPGAIGEFIGEIDRNGCSITIRGEKGSGKSHLLYQFAQSFQQLGWKGMFFTLEEGIGATTQSKVKQYQIGEQVLLNEEPYLEEIRAAARRMDFVLIDSWGKTDGKMKEFDQLRKDFPETIFVSIFQENQNGSIRGGSSFEYDATITIETSKVHDDDGTCKDRLARITKSRYESRDTFSIQNQKVLQ